jgi:hypothetical protein
MDPREYKSFPTRAGFHCAHIPFKAGFLTVRFSRKI